MRILPPSGKKLFMARRHAPMVAANTVAILLRLPRNLRRKEYALLVCVSVMVPFASRKFDNLIVGFPNPTPLALSLRNCEFSHKNTRARMATFGSAHFQIYIEWLWISRNMREHDFIVTDLVEDLLRGYFAHSCRKCRSR